MTGIIAALTLVVVACTAAFYGWRGRRVDRHPVCRRCRFDLYGLPSDSRRCSECGASLRKRRAVLVGNRHRHIGMALAASLFLIASWAWFALTLYGVSREFDLQQHKPFFWLERETECTDVATRDAALQELLRRLGAQHLSQPQIDRLVLAALAHQRDRQKPWTPLWGRIIESASESGHVTLQQWMTYASQSMNLLSRTEPFVHRGQWLRYEEEVVARRVGDACFEVWIQYGPMELSRQNGLDTVQFPYLDAASNYTTPSHHLFDVSTVIKLPFEQLRDGAYTLRVPYEFTIREQITPARIGASAFPPGGVVVRGQRVMESHVTVDSDVVPRDRGLLMMPSALEGMP